MRPLTWIIIGALVGAPAYAIERLIISDLQIISHESQLYVPILMFLSAAVMAGIIIGIIGLWKLCNARKAKNDPTFYDERPVSMTRQTIYALFPILDLYAAYKIKKFWALFLILIAFGTVLVTAFYFLQDIIGFSDDIFFPIPFEMLVTVLLVREWSRRWNKKFETSVMN